MLDRLMFDNLRFPPFAVMVGCVRAKASVRPSILHDVVMNELFNGGVFDFIGLGSTNNWIVLCE